MFLKYSTHQKSSRNIYFYYRLLAGKRSLHLSSIAKMRKRTHMHMYFYITATSASCVSQRKVILIFAPRASYKNVFYHVTSIQNSWHSPAYDHPTDCIVFN